MAKLSDLSVKLNLDSSEFDEGLRSIKHRIFWTRLSIRIAETMAIVTVWELGRWFGHYLFN